MRIRLTLEITRDADNTSNEITHDADHTGYLTDAQPPAGFNRGEDYDAHAPNPPTTKHANRTLPKK